MDPGVYRVVGRGAWRRRDSMARFRGGISGVGPVRQAQGSLRACVRARPIRGGDIQCAIALRSLGDWGGLMGRSSADGWHWWDVRVACVGHAGEWVEQESDGFFRGTRREWGRVWARGHGRGVRGAVAERYGERKAMAVGSELGAPSNRKHAPPLPDSPLGC